MAKKPKKDTAVSSWSEFCRTRGYKNLGGGRASISTDYFPSIINLNPDGTLSGSSVPTISDDQIEYFRDNYEKIITEIFPTMPVPSGAGLPPTKDGSILYKYLDKDNALNLVVERFIRQDGNKQCLPWFYYEDKGWICQDAPRDFKTPLYGNHHGRSRVMIHEGEKAVDAAIAACSADSDHPWAEFLRMFGHCTSKGGAIAGMPLRADWSELDQVKEAYIMPDNDQEGYEYAKIVSEKLRSDAIYCVHWNTFKDTVPRKWDIADECPDITAEVLANAFDLYEPAITVFYDDEGKPRQRLRDEFAKKFALVRKLGELVEIHNPKNYCDATRFNQIYGHLAPGTQNLAKLLYESPHTVKVDRPGYSPKMWIEDGRYVPPHRLGRSSDGGDSTINMYRPTMLAEKVPEDTVTSLRPFLTYMTKVFPNPRERKTIIRWLCHNLTAGTPEERATWAVLMISTTEGTGKSTLGNLVRRVIGIHNVSKISGHLLNDKYTGWMENVQLVLVEELKETSAFRLAESLKDKISEASIPIRRMNTDPYETDNHISLLASSNHMSALSLGKKDRRWFIPQVTESLTPWNKFQAARYLAMPKGKYGGEFFTALWKWFNEGGDRYLLWYLRRYGMKLHERKWGEKNNHPPVTERKSSVIERSMGEWQSTIENEFGEERMICLQDLAAWLKENSIRAPKAEALGEFLEDLGYVRMFRDLEATDDKTRNGRVYLMRKQSGSYVVGHVYGKEDAARSEWKNLKPFMNWISDKYKGLAAHDKDTAPAGAEGAMTNAF